MTFSRFSKLDKYHFFNRSKIQIYCSKKIFLYPLTKGFITKTIKTTHIHIQRLQKQTLQNKPFIFISTQ